MYLSQLNLEKKKLFLDLCIYAALADNNFAQEEKATIDAYCEEMGLEQSSYEVTQDLDTILKELKMKCSKEEINFVLIEITALIMADNIYDSTEEEFMGKMQKVLDVSQEKIDKVFLAINHLKISYNMLNEIIVE